MIDLNVAAAIAQDAYHYAAAAALRDDSVFEIGERSVFELGKAATRGDFLRNAYAKARKAGLKVARPRRLADAAKLVEEIRAAAAALGIDAHRGELVDRATR